MCLKGRGKIEELPYSNFAIWYRTSCTFPRRRRSRNFHENGAIGDGFSATSEVLEFSMKRKFRDVLHFPPRRGIPSPMKTAHYFFYFFIRKSDTTHILPKFLHLKF